MTIVPWRTVLTKMTVPFSAFTQLVLLLPDGVHGFNMVPIVIVLNTTILVMLIKHLAKSVAYTFYRVFRNECYKSNCTLLGLVLILWFPKGGKIF